MVLYDIACGLLSKSVSMGATYTLPMLCSLHLASFAFCLKILFNSNTSFWAQILIVSPGQRPHCPSCYKQGVFLRAARGEQEQEPGHGA